MATTTTTVTQPQEGTTVPEATQLRTGDLLFARAAPGVAAPLISIGQLLEWAGPVARRASVRELIGSTRAQWIEAISGDQARTDARLDDIGIEKDGALEAMRAIAADRIAFLVAVLKVEFKDITRVWLNLSVDDFLKHPLVRVLFRAFEGHAQDNFFVGHCAMVLRERDGEHDPNGTAYVIEANATSFARYGVAMRPYLVPGDAVPYRSWAGFRVSRGDHVWSARHKTLAGSNDARTEAIRRRLLVAAKRYIGRAYSFFDSPDFAHAGRLYCSELIWRAFNDVQSGLDGEPPCPDLAPLDDTDVRTWAWMRQNNPKMRADDIGDAIEQVWNHQDTSAFVQTDRRPFFILTVQMLWRTAQVQQAFRPGGADYG